MAENLRAAVERLREFVALAKEDQGGCWAGAGLSYTLCSSPNPDGTPSVDDLAALLAEHPADDGEPVTERWLRAAGCLLEVELRDVKRFRLAMGVHVLAEACPGPECWRYCVRSDGRDVLVAKPTRGQVRRLASVLGIKLAEPNGR